MATADQIKALLASHLEGNEERFFSVALQVAAHEARAGHGKLAVELRALVDKAKNGRGARTLTAGPISAPNGAGGIPAGLLEASYPKCCLGDMVLGDGVGQQLARVVREQRHASRIVEQGLSPRSKLLLVGPPGTGKTMTASVLAGELGIALLQVRLDALITKYMGETAARLRQVFDSTSRTRGVYFFDEFDAIGSQRGATNDVGEIRRVLNSFLQMIEQERSHSMVVAATNHSAILDPALFRRFDDVLYYDLPDEAQITKLLQARLAGTAAKPIAWARLASAAAGLSHADVTRAANEAMKDALISSQSGRVHQANVVEMLDERMKMSVRWRTTTHGQSAPSQKELSE